MVTETAASKGRILVVDDDRLVLATVAHGLAQAGYEVIDADNGDEAILLARQHRPQLALLDIRMEGKSGFDVARTLRDAYRIPFMFLSAFSDEATLAQVHALGAMAYLVKPLDVGQIVPSVQAAFERLQRGEVSGFAAAVAVAAPAPAQPVAAHSAVFSDPIPLAVGLLMHRHSLTRDAAWQRLQKLAADQGLPAAMQAGKLVAAIEELARSAG